jgi:Tol biopolymer transport system component
MLFRFFRLLVVILIVCLSFVTFVSNPSTGLKYVSDGFSADLSSDGQEIVLVDLVGQDYDMSVLDSNGQNKRQLTDNDLYDEFQPRWSPDGKQIVFVRIMNAEREFWQDIFILDTNSLTERRITHSSYFKEYPQWSPDGQQILFQGEDGLYLISQDGTNQRSLLSLPTPIYSPSWSPDGSHILFTSTYSSYALFVAGEYGEDLKEFANNALEPHWSPDGSRMLVSIHPGDYSYNVFIWENGDLEQISPDHQDCRSSGWSPDGMFVSYYCLNIRHSSFNVDTYITDLRNQDTWDLNGNYLVQWSNDMKVMMLESISKPKSGIYIAD